MICGTEGLHCYHNVQMTKDQGVNAGSTDESHAIFISYLHSTAHIASYTFDIHHDILVVVL